MVTLLLSFKGIEPTGACSMYWKTAALQQLLSIQLCLMACAGGDPAADSGGGKKHHPRNRIHQCCGRGCLHPGSPEARDPVLHRHEQLHDVRPPCLALCMDGILQGLCCKCLGHGLPVVSVTAGCIGC